MLRKAVYLPPKAWLAGLLALLLILGTILINARVQAGENGNIVNSYGNESPLYKLKRALYLKDGTLTRKEKRELMKLKRKETHWQFPVFR